MDNQKLNNLLKNPNTNWKYLLIIVVLAFLAGGGILGYQYWWLPRKEIEMPEIELPEKVVEDETAGWKVYTNQSLGFSFEYPSDWLDAETNILSTRTSIIIKDGKELDGLRISRLEVVRGFYYNQAFQREMTFAELIDAQSFPTEALTSEKVTLKEWEGTRFTHHVHGVGYFVTHIFLAKLNNPTDIISFVYRHNDPIEYKSEMPQTLDQILSTFRFIEKEEFCGWSTQGVCASDLDCIIGGCSSQVCQSKNEEPITTTCEFKECYLAQNYGFECKCVNNKCQWSK